MFNTGSQPTITKSMVESANSGLESADSRGDFNANPAKVGLWVQALSAIEHGGKNVVTCDTGFS